MQVFPATAVKGNSEKDIAQEEFGDPEGSFPPMIAFSPFTKPRNGYSPLKKRARANRKAEVKKEVKTAGREPRIPVHSTAS